MTTYGAGQGLSSCDGSYELLLDVEDFVIMLIESNSSDYYGKVQFL